MSNTKKKNILIIIATLVIIAIITSGVYAIVKYLIEEDYSASSATNYYRIVDVNSSSPTEGDYYYNEILDGTNEQLDSTFLVNLNIKNYYSSLKGNNDYFDLIIYTNRDTVAPIMGTTSITKEVMQYGVERNCHIYKSIQHINSSPQAITTPPSNIDYHSNMPITLSFVGASNEDAIDIVVVDHNDKNVFINNFYELQTLNNEGLFNNYHSYEFGEFAEIAAGRVVITEQDITITEIGKIIYDASIESGGIKTEVLNGKITTVDGTRNIVFETAQIEFESGHTLAGSESFVFLETEAQSGVFINPKYGIKLEISGNDITFYNLPYQGSSEQKFIYFIGDVTIEKAFTLNIPSYINLLYSKLTLMNDFSIEHHYGGAYAIDSINTKDVNETLKAKVFGNNVNFNIFAPYSFYITSSIDTVIQNGINYSKDSEMVDFSDPTNDSLLNELIDDALEFAKNSIPQYIYNNVVLPKQYHRYPIVFSYSDHSAINQNGNIVRGQNNTVVKDYIITATAKFDSVQKIKTISADEFTIIGTLASAKFDYLKNIIQNRIDIASIASDETLTFQNSQEIGSIIAKFILDLDIDINFTIRKTSQLQLELQYMTGDILTKYEAEEIVLSIEEPNGENIIEIYASGGTSMKKLLATYNKTTETIEYSSSIVLRPKQVVLTDTTEKLFINFNDGIAKSLEVNINVIGMSFENKTKYIARYLTTLYLGDDNKKQDILSLITGQGFYVGDNNVPENLVIPTDLGATSLGYIFYKVEQTSYDQYLAGTMTLEELVLARPDTDITSVFDIANGLIQAGSSIKLNVGETIISIATINFTSDVPEESTYIGVRQVKIPAKGIGSDDYTDYTNGNTFGEYFATLNENRLLYSIADVEGVEGTAFDFTTFHEAINIDMKIPNTVGLSAFITLVQHATNRNIWQINIDPTNVPTTNTTINLEVEFYTINSSNNSRNVISTQKYDFIIPGIYRLGRDVDNADIYQEMIQTYGTGFVNQAGVQEYLLVDEAERQVDIFDASVIFDVSVISSDNSISIKGVELLTNTRKMLFDNLKISSLAPFGNVQRTRLQELSLKKTGITTEMITEIKIGADRASLYYLISLQSIDLSNNSITALLDSNGQSYLYRTVTKLNLSNKVNLSSNVKLSSIEGLSELPFLAEVDISNNSIAVFNELENCKAIKKVNLSNNTPTNIPGSDTNITFGSSGSINIPVYVALHNKGVNIVEFVDKEEKIEKILQPIDLYTPQEKLASLVINAITYYNVQSQIEDAVRIIKFAQVATSNITNPQVYDIIIHKVIEQDVLLTLNADYTLKVDNTDGDNMDKNTTISISTVTSGDVEYKIIVGIVVVETDIVGIVVGETEIFKQFKITHRS